MPHAMEDKGFKKDSNLPKEEIKLPQTWFIWNIMKNSPRNRTSRASADILDILL